MVSLFRASPVYETVQYTRLANGRIAAQLSRRVQEWVLTGSSRQLDFPETRRGPLRPGTASRAAPGNGTALARSSIGGNRRDDFRKTLHGFRRARERPWPRYARWESGGC